MNKFDRQYKLIMESIMNDAGGDDAAKAAMPIAVDYMRGTLDDGTPQLKRRS